ncbi:MAG: hypothetical protein K8R48_02000 [Alphaproteobacteria bacterium]|nr:hypothetical protein [Alphaproteobacteria bacterium]
MKPQYEGRSPGRLWYARQRTKAFISTFRNASTKSEAKSLGKNAGILVGCVATGGFVASNITLLGIPSLVAGALFVGGAYFGVKGFGNFRSLKRSGAYSNYVRAQEDKWVARQSRPKLGARIKALFTKAGTVLGYALATAGAALATTAGLQMGGVISSVALTTVLGSVAAAVSLPVIIGVAAAAIPLGIIGGIVCRKATRRLLGIKPGEKKAAVAVKTIEAKNDNKTAIKTQSATSSFTTSATVTKPSPELSDERKKAAEERQRNKKKGPSPF